MTERSVIELSPLEESPATYDLLEARLKKFFKDFLYIPLLRELAIPKKTLKNAPHRRKHLAHTHLTEALLSGRVTYSHGVFSGKLSAGISKDLRDLGARFDRTTSSYRIAESKIAQELRPTIAASEARFEARMARFNRKLDHFNAHTFASQFECKNLFDQTLFRADKDFRKNIKKITTAPELSAAQRSQISTEWQNNLQLSIEDWAQSQITDLRAKVYRSVTLGARRESLIPPILKITKTLEKSHEAAVHKAKFLAHQETRLMMAAFKEVRYKDAGINEYIWRCRHKPHDHSPHHHAPGNVRFSHGLLDGKTFRFDSPPITSNPGQPVRRNNPGQDYNCFCHARPFLRKHAS